MAGGLCAVLEHEKGTCDRMSQWLLSAQNLTKEHGHGGGLEHAVNGVNLNVGAGESVAIVGPSGCGKSSLLYLLGGLDRPTAGKGPLGAKRVARVSETRLARLRRNEIGFVFQTFELIDELTAVENIEMPALLARVSPRAARSRAHALLDEVGLADRAGHLPSELSGGQRQRVAIARAIINKPKLILADEPTGSLDSAAMAEVLRLFESLRLAGLTLVIVAHDSRIAAMADRLISMRDGRFADEISLSDQTERTLGQITGLGCDS